MRPVGAMSAQLMRQLALDRNELRRASDRIEVWCALALIVAFVPLAVLSAICAASWVRADAAKQQHQQPLRQVTAVLVQSAPTDPAMPGGAAFPAAARWTVAGSTHAGYVPVVPGTLAGTDVRIWVDTAGKIEQPPPTAAQVSARVVLAMVAAPIGVALGLWLAWYAVKYLLDRRRLASWTHEWSSFGPSWTR
jgi:hypothetical protein